MPMHPRFVERLRANRTLGRHDQNRRVAPPNHNIYYPAITETNAPVVDNAATYTAVLPGDTSETDVVYEAVDEGAVALADVYNGNLKSNGAHLSNNPLEYPEFPSFTGEAEVLNGLNISPWDDVSEGPNEPEASVSALTNGRAVEEEERRPPRRTRTGKGRNPQGPAQAKKDKGKERAASTGPSDEDPDMPIRSAADEEATIHPPGVTRPRTRAVVRAEKSAAAAAAAAITAADSRKAKGKSRADEPASHPPAKNAAIRKGRGQKAKKVTSDIVADAARPDDAAPGPSRRRTRGVKHTVKPRIPSPLPPLVVPEGMRKLGGNRLVSAKPPAPRTRARRQLKIVPVVKEETVEDKKEEQPKRENKRTREDFEGDDAPDDAPPKKRSKYAHTSPEVVEQRPEALAEGTTEEEETALIVPETHTVKPQVETAEPAAPEVPEVAILEVPAALAVEELALAEEQAAAPPIVAAPQLPAHLAVLPLAFHAVPVPHQQIPQGLVPAQPAAIPLNRPLRRSETTLLFGKIYRR